MYTSSTYTCGAETGCQAGRATGATRADHERSCAGQAGYRTVISCTYVIMRWRVRTDEHEQGEQPYQGHRTGVVSRELCAQHRECTGSMHGTAAPKCGAP